MKGAVPPLTRLDTSRLTVPERNVVWSPGLAMLGAAFTRTLKLALDTAAPALSVTVTVTAPKVWAALVIVPLINPPLVRARVAGPLFST